MLGAALHQGCQKIVMPLLRCKTPENADDCLAGPAEFLAQAHGGAEVPHLHVHGIVADDHAAALDARSLETRRDLLRYREKAAAEGTVQREHASIELPLERGAVGLGVDMMYAAEQDRNTCQARGDQRPELRLRIVRVDQANRSAEPLGGEGGKEPGQIRGSLTALRPRNCTEIDR